MNVHISPAALLLPYRLSIYVLKVNRDQQCSLGLQ
jgi:hypothetical protein